MAGSIGRLAGRGHLCLDREGRAGHRGAPARRCWSGRGPLDGLIEAFPNLAPEHRAEAVRLLTQAEPGINDDDQRAAISDSLRALLNHHRTVPDAAWALPGDE